MKFTIYSADAITNRLNTLRTMRETIIKDGVESYHIKLQGGNKKTGVLSRTVSLVPGLDCKHCGKCLYGGCYDIQHDMWRPHVMFDRAKNSAIHKMDFDRYWDEIDKGIEKDMVQLIRFNVGGDFEYRDFMKVKEIAKKYPDCYTWIATKNGDDLNEFVYDNANDIPENMSAALMLSDWKGQRIENPWGLTTTHVLYEDGSTTADLSKPHYICTNDCSRCLYNYKNGNIAESGCFGHDQIIFKAH